MSTSVKVSVPDQSKTAVSPQTVSSVSVSRWMVCWWMTCGGAAWAAGAATSRLSAAVVSRRAAGRIDTVLLSRCSASCRALVIVWCCRVGTGAGVPAAKGVGRGCCWRARALFLPVALQGVPSGLAGALLLPPLHWLGPTTSFDASAGRNIRGGFKMCLRLATVLDPPVGRRTGADRAQPHPARIEDKVAATQQKTARSTRRLGVGAAEPVRSSGDSRYIFTANPAGPASSI